MYLSVQNCKKKFLCLSEVKAVAITIEDKLTREKKRAK